MIGEEVYKKKKGALKKGIETSLWAANAHLFLNITFVFLHLSSGRVLCCCSFLPLTNFIDLGQG